VCQIYPIPTPATKWPLKNCRQICFYCLHLIFYCLHTSNVEIHAISCALGLSMCVLFLAQRTVCAVSTLSPRPRPKGRIQTAVLPQAKLLTPCLELFSSLWSLGQRSLEIIGESNLGILGPSRLQGSAWSVSRRVLRGDGRLSARLLSTPPAIT
jgi:hypothetical protein